MTYPISRIAAHMKETGLDFHAAKQDLETRFGAAPVYPCSECGEIIVSEPDTMCGACLFDDDYASD